MAKRKSGGLLESLKTIVYAALIAVVIRTVAFEPFNIPSGSMIPTLLIGDYLFVSKYSYGYSRFSLPFAPDLFQGRIFKEMPKRGDVVVFKNPHQESTDYIKRIIGLPGDRIQVKGGQLLVNGVEVARKLVGDYTSMTSDDTPDMQRPVPIEAIEYSETLPGGKTHPILKETDQGWPNNTPEYVVPPNSLFAMGDNRDNSQDSRFQDAVGFIPMDNLVGRAEFIFFSIDATAPWWEFWEWPFEIRWSRLFTGIN